MIWDDEKVGIGSWYRFPREAVDDLFAAAEDWREQSAGVEKPWLCWGVDPDWCLLQQRLVKSCGWTPLVGTDGNCSPPPLVPGAAFVDFNRRLRLPSMWMHFPVELAFVFAERLAFWHSDVLPPVETMERIGRQFDAIEPGQYLGIRDVPGLRRRWRRFVKGPRRWSFVNAQRWFEVVGCTTREASRSQYDCGCGIWRLFQHHPNATERIKRIGPHYDHGVGVWYWEKHFGGNARELDVDIHPYHYNAKGLRRVVDEGRTVYDRATMVYKGAELKHNHQLAAIVPTLGLAKET